MSAVVVYNASNLSAILIALIIILIFNDRFTLPCTDCTYYSSYMFVLHQTMKRCGDFPLGCDDWMVHMGCECPCSCLSLHVLSQYVTLA